MNHARPLIALARMLDYPEAEMRGHTSEFLEAAGELAAGDDDEAFESLRSLGTHLEYTDLLDLQAEYVETFDRGRSTSLNLYEHLYGDGRGRGPAMADLASRYEHAGLHMTARQLPDFLPVFLEYASTLNEPDAREALYRMATALIGIATALERRKSPWLAAVVSVLRFAGIMQWRSAGKKASPEFAETSAPDWAPGALDAAWTEEPIQFLGAADPCRPVGRGRESSINGADHGSE